ncbi:MAG: AraC family transcriptional regulator [Cyanobacteria bacterium P01_D01_bin.105]
MTTRLQLRNWTDWLTPSCSGDSQLFHADVSDDVHICPSHLGQGYFQKIRLQDDLTLVILDYTLNQDLVIESADQSCDLELTFHLDGCTAGYSFFCPASGSQRLGVIPANRRFFKVEVFCKQPAHIHYYHSFLERLSPQMYDIAEHLLQTLSRSQGRRTKPTLAKAVEQLPKMLATTSDSLLRPEVVDLIYDDTIALQCAAREQITPGMNRIIGQILSCPYQGKTRRTYLERKVLELIALRFEAMLQRDLSDEDLAGIYQAGRILRQQLAHPPSVDALARLVSTNRFKLNQGFRQVYGTTPFGYVRDCRLQQAKRLLITSEPD